MADNATIIVKKIKKGGGGHHGGAWKVAYADFVTAMMAFFLLLWLLNSVTQEQLEGISNYFAPAAPSATTSGSGDVLGGTTVGEPGAQSSMSSRSVVTMKLTPPEVGTGGQEEAGEETPKPQDEEIEEEEAEAIMRKLEEQQFQQAELELREAIQQIPGMEQLSKSLLIDNTPEGLRIQIVDQEGLAMFPRGAADMYEHTRSVLELVAKVIQRMPQKIAISGHTDSTKFGRGHEYTNWELSADRANASRRALLELNVSPERISRVIGMAAQQPLLPEDPTNPRNRRLTIVLMRGTGQPPAPSTPPAN